MGPATERRGKGQGSVFYAKSQVHKYGARGPYVKGVPGPIIGFLDSRHAAQKALDKWLAENQQKEASS